MRISLVFNRTGKPNKDGVALIQLRAYQNRKSKFYSTNVYILPRQWKNGKVVDHPNARELNLKLKRIVREIETYLLQQEMLGKKLTFDSLHRFFRYEDHTDFHEFCQVELERDHSLHKNTKKQHRVTLGYLRKFKPQLCFGDLNYSLIYDFNNYLVGKKLGTNTIHSHHRRLKRYINLAIKKELFPADQYPYKHYKLKKAETKRDVLTLEELQRIEQVEIPKEQKHLEVIRDMFLFGCYTGLRFSDIAGLKRNMIHQGSNKMILKLIAQKTGKAMDLPLHILHEGKPARLLEDYLISNYRKQELFPGITNQYANRCLKKIGSLIESDKRVTTHVARHTFATHLALKVKPALLQQLLQHSRIETTMIYVDLSERMLIEELKKVNW